MTDGTGLVRLGRLDQTSLVITWLAWWPLPPGTDGYQSSLGLHLRDYRRYRLDAGRQRRGPDQMVDFNTSIYAAQSIPDFDAWLDARLAEVEDSPLVQDNPGH